MLTLRKEIKVGFGIGAAVLGVAAVYGAMSLLTSRGDGTSTPIGSQHVSQETGPDVVIGLPPETEVAGANPAPGLGGSNSAAAPAQPADPFAESARSDGIASDPWTAALTTGRVPTADKAVTEKTADVIVTRTPSTVTEPTSLAGAATPAPAGRVAEAQPSRSTNAPVDSVSSNGGQTYIIASGDTFSSIAGKHYGNRNLYSAIMRANPDIDPARLKVGTKIVLPPADAVKNERGSLAAPARPETGAIDTTREYRVQSGDTLHGISKRLYGRTNYWMAIYDLNKAAIGNDAGRLKVGTVLTLPQRPNAR